MDEADAWAEEQLFTEGSPWSYQNGWSGWRTTSVAYQIDAWGGVDFNYRFTVDFY